MIGSLFFATFVGLVLLVDRIFMPGKARKAWQLMAFFYTIALLIIGFPEFLASLATFLGVGRGIDIILYLSVFILVRELFLSRSRQSSLERQMTIIARKIAIQEVEEIHGTEVEALNNPHPAHSK